MKKKKRTCIPETNAPYTPGDSKVGVENRGTNDGGKKKRKRTGGVGGGGRGPQGDINKGRKLRRRAKVQTNQKPDI